MALAISNDLLTSLLQSKVDRPSEDICNRIASLQGLAEMGGKAVDWRRGPPAPQKYTHRPSTAPTSIKSVEGPPTYVAGAGRYQSKFKNSMQPVEEKILNNIILSKLNKFSTATYGDVRDFLYQILGGGEADLQEFVRDFMRLVFRKAASEEIFCPLYAKLIAEISGKYTVIIDEMKTLIDNYLEIFDEVTEDRGADYASFVQKNTEKKYRLGYSQFLSELAKQEILPLPVLGATFSKLIGLIKTTGPLLDKTILVEEYTDCISRMARVFKGRSTPFSRKAKELILPPFLELYQDLLANKENYGSCSAKTRFIFMDIHDILRS
uniref:MIF4G domain-containing protein n=1 Tax=viral metagenome TaxID=1070528 RepID=A0A6C0BC89_9ZZZZ